MLYDFLSFVINRSGLRFFIIASIILFVFNLIFLSDSSPAINFINSLLVIVTAFYCFTAVYQFQKKKQFDPVKLVIGLMIISGLILFIFQLSDPFLTLLGLKLNEIAGDKNLITNSFLLMYTLLILVLVTISLVILYEFYMLKQRRRSKTYFNAFIIFLILSCISTAFEKDFSFVKMAFTANAIILIAVNSVKISWIAFLTKKEKKTILWLSVITILLISFSLASFHKQEVMSIINKLDSSVYQLTFIMLLYGLIYLGILFFTTLFHLPTAEAIDRKSVELSSLQNFSKLINQVLDRKELTETISELAIKVSNADSSWLYLEEIKSNNFIASKNIEKEEIEVITDFIIKNYKNKISSKVIIIGLPFGIFKDEKAVFSEIAVVPLKSHSKVNGIVIVAKKLKNVFEDEDRKALETLSDYASIAIENSRLLNESIEKERLEKELDVARTMQQKLLPQNLPKSECCDFSAVFIPAFEVGGDYYDFFKLENNKIGFVIADVSGKGISAAFIMAEVRGIFESLSKILQSPKEILIHANKILMETLDSKSFVTAIYAVIDSENKIVQFARAGHTTVIKAQEDEVLELKPNGIGLGLTNEILFDSSLELETITLDKECKLIFYTDGITEAKNSNNEDFGIERIKNILKEENHKNAEDISQSIITNVMTFSESSPQHDDLTLVIFNWKDKHGEEKNV